MGRERTRAKAASAAFSIAFASKKQPPPALSRKSYQQRLLAAAAWRGGVAGGSSEKHLESWLKRVKKKAWRRRSQ